MALTKVSGSLITGKHFNVLDFGADPTGSSDSTQAFKDAINQVGRLVVSPPDVSQVGGGTVYIPAGKYKITDTLYYPSSVSFIGDGMYGSSIEFEPTSSKNCFEPDPSKLGAGVSIYGVSFCEFSIIGKNSNANDGITTISGTSAYAEFIRATKVLVKGFSGNGMYIGQDVVASGSTYFNKIDQCSFRQNSVNLQIGYWGGPTVIVGGYMVADGSQAYQIINRHNGTTIIGLSMDGVPTAAQIYSVNPIDTSGIRREQASSSSNIPFLELEYDNTNGQTFQGTVDLSKNWYGLDGSIIKVNNYISTGADPANVRNAFKGGINADFGSPKSHPELIPNGNTEKGLYNWTKFGTNSTLSYQTTEKFLSTGALSLTTSSGHTLSSIKYTIPGAKLTPFVGTRLWVTFLVKSTTTDYFVRLNGAGQSHTNAQSYSNATAIFGDWRLHAVSTQIVSASDLALEVFCSDTSPTDTVYLAGINVYSNGFRGMPEAAAEARFEASSAPSNGTWAVGDIVYHSSPAPGGNIGWVCTTAGSPGTWKTFGTIAV